MYNENNNNNNFSDIDAYLDEMFGGGNIKVPPPIMLNKQSKNKSNIETLYEKTNKELIVLNKQYNKLLVESNTLRKRVAFYENKLRDVDRECSRLSSNNKQLRNIVNDLEVDIKAIKNKLGLNNK